MMDLNVWSLHAWDRRRCSGFGGRVSYLLAFLELAWRA